VQSLGCGSHFSSGGHAGVAQSLPPVTSHDQPLTQSEFALQLPSAWARRGANPSNVSANKDGKVKYARIGSLLEEGSSEIDS